jgi:hypothetical protein
MKEFRNTGYFATPEGVIIGKRKILKPTITPDGYHSVCLYYQGKTKTFLVHRIIAECFIENKFNKPDVNHDDGNKLNNNVTNLEWSTKKENVNHFLEKLSDRKYGEHPNSKIKFDDLLKIHEWVSVEGIYVKDIAKKLNVHESTISRAIRMLKNQPKEIR